MINININLINKIQSIGFDKPTLVQEKTYGLFNAGLSGIILSPTGTGKTHAYLIPLVEKIDVNKDEVQAVIIVPTNELVMQVGYMLKGMNSEITHKALTTRDDRNRTIQSLAFKQPQVIISTPGRLLDMVVKENVLKTHTASYLIIDEADMLFDYDFVSQMDPVTSKIKGLAYVFSATMPKNIVSWINKYFGKAELLDLSNSVELKIEHALIMGSSDKDVKLFKLLKLINPYLCFIFVSKNEDIDPLFDKILLEGYNAVKLTSKIPIRQRKNIIDLIKQLRYQYVVCSDIASRGLDFEGISHIINYDLPYKTEFYIHRSGRTGRMGREGIVYTFYEDKYSRKLSSIQNLGIEFEKYTIKGNELVKQETKIKTLTEQEVSAIRKIKKPARVKPNYKKKNKREVKKALTDVRTKKMLAEMRKNKGVKK